MSMNEQVKNLQPIKIEGALSPFKDRGTTAMIYKFESGQNIGNILRVAKTDRDDITIARHHDVISSFNGFLQPRLDNVPKSIAFGTYNGRVADIETFIPNVLGNIEGSPLMNKITDKTLFLKKAIDFFEKILKKKGF